MKQVMMALVLALGLVSGVSAQEAEAPKAQPKVQANVNVQVRNAIRAQIRDWQMKNKGKLPYRMFIPFTMYDHLVDWFIETQQPLKTTRVDGVEGVWFEGVIVLPKVTLVGSQFEVDR